MGHLGFSYIGLLAGNALCPQLVLGQTRQPTGYTSAEESRLLAALERIGEAGVTCCALVFSNFNLRPLSPRSLWLALSLALMMAYECWWVRYFRSERTLRDFYRPLLGVPVAGATLPVLAVLALGIYGRVIWMVLAALVLGVGHIGIHLQHRREIEG